MISIYILGIGLCLMFFAWVRADARRMDEEDRREELTRQHRRLKAEPRY